MFTTHFKMTDFPFSEKPPIDGILKDERINQGLARLSFLKNTGIFALITGDAGVGKSSLIRLFIDSFKRSPFNLIYLHFTRLESLSFLKTLARALGEIPERGKEKVLAQIQNKITSSDIPTILLIDEAHLLDSDVLIDLRLFVSSAIEETNRLKMILVGHSDIKKELRRARLDSLLQRITIRYHLPPMTLSQTKCYIDFQMRRVNCSEKIFEEEVKNDIHEYSRGIPRLVNNIASACLINAVIMNHKKIGNGILLQALNEITLV